MSRLPSWMRRHLPFIVIAPLLIIAMTWPTLPQVLDADSLWLYTGGSDPWYKFWDAWHLKRALAGQADYYFSDSIFHPQGVSLAFHQIALPHALVFGGLQAVLPLANAYNLCFLLMLFINACSAYLLLWHLLGDRWISVFGALLFSLAPQFLVAPILPDLILVAPLPLAIYCLQRAVAEGRLAFAALAGLALGFTAFISLYIYVCLWLSLAMYAAALAPLRWRTRSFWRLLLALIAVAAALSALRFYPIVADIGSLSAGAEKYSGMDVDSVDLGDYLFNRANPWTAPILRDVFDLNPRKAVSAGYIGYLPLILLAAGILRRGRRRAMLPWLGLLCVFLALRLGDHLTFDGKAYPDILLPKFYLNQALPLLFDGFGFAARFQLGVVLPLAALSCYGLSAALDGRAPRVRCAVVGVCLLFLAFEYYVPIGGRTLEPERIAHLAWLRQEDSAPVKLINLPIRRNLDKYYMFLQTLGEYPQANGATNRTPGSAYSYLNDNFLLYAWRDARNVNCSPSDGAEISEALDQLAADGFTHIVFHRRLAGSVAIRPGLTTLDAAYQDDHVAIYRMADLRESCGDPRVAGEGSLAPFRALAQGDAIPLNARFSIVSVHPSLPLDYKDLERFTAEFSDWKSLVHLFHADDEMVMQSANRRYVSERDLDARDKGLLVIYDPRVAKSDHIPSNYGFIERAFRLCEQPVKTEAAILELYVKRGVPCELLLSRAPLRVSYEGGLQLDNLHYELKDRALDLYVLWNRVPETTLAFSIQLFDEAGGKAFGQDFLIHRDPETHHRLELDPLEAGVYAAKLIVYRYASLESVPGVKIRSGARFDRELQIARLKLE